MTVGASFDQSRGGTAFRLWAPGSSTVEVQARLGGAPAWNSQGAMAQGPDGYWEHFALGVASGHEYRYVL
jgi:1,4-alpha-glucan branching enzyme